MSFLVGPKNIGTSKALVTFRNSQRSLKSQGLANFFFKIGCVRGIIRNDEAIQKLGKLKIH